MRGVRAYVSVGSNIDREASVRGAVRALEARFGPLHLSPVFESAAVGFDGPAFYNLVVGFDTAETAAVVAEALHAIEDGHGRDRSRPRFSSRRLDLDLLLLGSLVADEAGLRLPRQDVVECAFVLGPLAALAPRDRHPETGETFAALWARFDARDAPLAPVALDLGAGRRPDPLRSTAPRRGQDDARR